MRRPEPLPPLLCDADLPLPVFESASQSAPGCPEFEGAFLLENFLSEGEAVSLLEEIERWPFLPSQSGKQKQHFGPKVNFNKRRLNASAFDGLPAYSADLNLRFLERLMEHSESTNALRSVARAFEPTDVFVLRYREGEASNLDFHLDDTFAYGEMILDLSLEADSVMTFYRDRPGGEIPLADNRTARPACVRVPLPARSLLILSGAARYEWEHALLARDIRDQRTSLTFRTLGPELAETDQGKDVLASAKRLLSPNSSFDSTG